MLYSASEVTTVWHYRNLIIIMIIIIIIIYQRIKLQCFYLLNRYHFTDSIKFAGIFCNFSAVKLLTMFYC